MATPNQLSPREVQELAELYKKVLGYTDAIATSEANRAQSIGTARQQLELMRKELEDMTKDITEQVQAFRDIAKEISGQRDGIKETVKGFKSLLSIAEKIQYHQKDISELSNKDIESLEKKLKIEKQRFEETDKQLKKEKTALDTSLTRTQAEMTALRNKANWTDDDLEKEIELEQIQQNITAELNKNIKAQDEIKGIVEGTDANYNATLNTLRKIKKENTEINRKMGLGGALAKSLAKNLPAPLAEYMGLDDVISKMKEAAKDAKGIGGGLKVAGVGLKAAGGNIMSGMMSGSNPYLLIGGLLVKIIQFFIELMFDADKRVTELARGLNISKDAARGVYKEAQNIAKSVGEYGTLIEGNLINEKDILETQSKFNSVLGMSVNLIDGFGDRGKKVLYQLTDMVKFLQLSDDELKGIVNLSVVQGKEVEDTKNQILGQLKLYKIRSGMQIDERKALKDVLTTSNAIRLSMKGGMDALIKSVAESQKLGKSLNELSKIGDSLLNFEQSISSELEAELLLGRDLNLERARGAYFSGDMKSFQEEVNRLVKESGPDFKKNVIAQQALASALGISREELADMVAEQEKFEKFQDSQIKLGEKDIEILNKKLEGLGKVNGLEEGIKNSLMSGNVYGRDLERILTQAGFAGEDLTNVLGQIASNSLESTDAQQKFNDSLEKAKDVFRTFVDGGSLDKLANMITGIVQAFNKGGLAYVLGGGAEEEAAAAELKNKYGITTKSGTGVLGTGAFKDVEFYDKEGKLIEDSQGSEGIRYFAEQLKEKEEEKQNALAAAVGKNNEDMKKVLEDIKNNTAATAKKETTLNYDSQKASVAGAKRESAIG